MARKLELQIALDCLRLEEALRLMEQVHPYVDIVEIGTPLIFEAGLAGADAQPPRAQTIGDRLNFGFGDIGLA